MTQKISMLVHFRGSECLILVLNEALSGLEIGLDHFPDEAVEVNLAFPTKKALGLGGITQQ